MSTINERLDRLHDLIQSKDFLEGKGLSNEVNIRIFCYDAADEMCVQHYIKQLLDDHSLNCNLIECNLYKIFLSICDDLDITDSMPEMEESDGGEYLLDQIQFAMSEKDFIDKMQYEPHQTGDVMLLTGVGDVFPFMRVHGLLEAMQPHYSDVPILVMYPGEFDGHQLELFNRLEPNDYYRAFNII